MLKFGTIGRRSLEALEHWSYSLLSVFILTWLAMVVNLLPFNISVSSHTYLDNVFQVWSPNYYLRDQTFDVC